MTDDYHLMSWEEAEEVLHNKKIEKARWGRLSEMVEDFDQAERLRFFLKRLEEATKNDPILEPKTRELTGWAEGYAW